MIDPPLLIMDRPLDADLMLLDQPIANSRHNPARLRLVGSPRQRHIRMSCDPRDAPFPHLAFLHGAAIPSPHLVRAVLPAFGQIGGIPHRFGIREGDPWGKLKPAKGDLPWTMRMVQPLPIIRGATRDIG